jgi:hypothetical protein
MRQRVAVHPVVNEGDVWRRVAVYLRPDGGYCYAEETRVCLTHDYEFTWTAEFDHNTRSGIYDSPEAALREAERDIVWLRDRLQQASDTAL